MTTPTVMTAVMAFPLVAVGTLTIVAVVQVSNVPRLRSLLVPVVGTRAMSSTRAAAGRVPDSMVPASRAMVTLEPAGMQPGGV